MKKSIGKLHETLESLYRTYNRRRFVGGDPVVFLHDFGDVRDREIVALVASSLAFGTVKQIQKSIADVLRLMDGAPADFVMDCSPDGAADRFSCFRHRWVGGGDLGGLLFGARRVIERYGSLEGCFAAAIEDSHRDALPALASFVDEIIAASGGGTGRLLALPCRGSACKRLNLFLRWMVRRDEVDPGGWSALTPEKLIVPLDTHMFRLSRALGLTERRLADLKAAREVTEAFREVSPGDPVKYDFALTRLGMLRGPGRDAALGILGGIEQEASFLKAAAVL